MRETTVCRCGRGTLYDVLQVSPWCEPEVIQAAYRALARTRHPDVNRDPDADEQMRRLNVAYQTLSDPARRTRYDEELALEVARPVTARPSPSPVAPAPAWTPPPPTPIRPRPSAVHAGHGSAAASTAAPQPQYQTTIFDAGGNMMLPRSAVYVSLVMVTVILALVAWLILDTMAQRPSVAPRFPQGHERSVPRETVALSQVEIDGAALTWLTADTVTLAWSSVDGATASRPGLSRSGARWNE